MQGGQPVTGFDEFVRVFGEDILPLLEEYCYEDYAALAKILGTALVDESGQRIHRELLERGQRHEIVQAVLAPSPELVTSREIVAQPQQEDEDAEEEGEEDGTSG